MATASISVVECEPCRADKTYNRAVSLCTVCREWYCSECSSQHRRLKLTKGHKQGYMDTPPDESVGVVLCDQCPETNREDQATTVCVQCREFYCRKCSSYHRNIKAARDHVIIDLVAKDIDVTMADVTSKLQGIRVTAREPDLLAAQCRKSTMVGSPPSSVQVLDPGTPLTATYTTEFSSKLPGDTNKGSYVVQSIVTLPDDRVVVLDFDNSKLKLFSADYQCQCYVDTDIGPEGLTVVGQSKVAITTTSNSITVYNIEINKLQKSKTIQCQLKDHGSLYDISYCDNTFVCLVGHGKTSERSIDIITMSGLGKEIVREKGTYMSVEHVNAGDWDCFYVTSCDPYQVRCFTYDGRQLWSVPLGSQPEGMILVRGRLCVLLLCEDRMCQISLDGRKYDEDVILHGESNPFTACYQRQRNRILVSSCTPGAPIKVYTID